MRILFITATRVGDAVLSTGILSALHQRHPEARFTIACGPAAAGVFSRFPALERLITIEKQTYDRHWLRLWLALWPTRFDLVIDLRGSGLSLFLRAGRRIVMRGGRRPGHRLTHLGGALALSPAPLPVVWTAPADRARAATLIADGAPVIALGPTANWDGKIWPADRFVALFQALADRDLPGARCAVFAGPGAQERAAAAPVLTALPAALDLCGQLSLPEAAACLQRCRLFIGNDSGLMHLAAASGVATLGLFGPSRADEYAPVGAHTAIAVARTTGEPAPIASLTLDAAYAAAAALLHQTTLAACA